MEAPRYLALGQHLASDVTSIVTANVTTGQQAAQVINSHFYVCSDSERINNIDAVKAPTLPSRHLPHDGGACGLQIGGRVFRVRVGDYSQGMVLNQS